MAASSSPSAEALDLGDLDGLRESAHSPLPQAEFLFDKFYGKVKIVLMEKIDKEVATRLREQGFEVVEDHRGLTGQPLIDLIHDATCIGIRSKSKVTREVLDACPKLLAIGCFCIGTNQVDLKAASERGVVVFNSPFENTRSVAEMIIAEIITLARQMGDRNKELHAGNWFKVSAKCFEIRGKKLGIVGYGHIGSQLSVLAEAMGMHVYFYDVIRKMPLGNSTRLDTLNSLLTTCDFVTLHVPETPETIKMIGPAQLAIMKQGAYLLNASRGTVVDIEALAESLQSGHLAGAAIDVYPTEPSQNGEGLFVSPLSGLPNVLLTPHIGGSTEEAQANIGRDVEAKLIKFIKTGKTIGCVNFPEVAISGKPGFHRLTNIHVNQPGVLRAINTLLSEYNVSAQILKTTESLGYIVIDVDADVSDLRERLAEFPSSIRTRILW